MDIQTAFYHARYQHLRNVLTALGPIRVAKAMTAFEDGRSNWSQCFFARAFEGELDLNNRVVVPVEILERKILAPEWQIMNALKFKTVIPIRFVWQAFDRHNRGTTREKLQNMCKEIVANQHNDAVEEFLKSIEFNPETPCMVTCEV